MDLLKFLRKLALAIREEVMTIKTTVTKAVVAAAAEAAVEEAEAAVVAMIIP